MKRTLKTLVGLSLVGISLVVMAALPFNVITKLKFDYPTDSPNLDGFLLFQSTNVALPLDQWTPVVGFSKVGLAGFPGTGISVPPVTNVMTSTGTYPLFFALASTNSLYGTNVMGFSNTASERGVPAGGSNLRP